MRIASDLFRPKAKRSRGRTLLLAAGFLAAYGVVGGRLVALGLGEPPAYALASQTARSISAARPDIRDRNAMLLATDLKTASLYAEPRSVIDVDEATAALVRALPELDYDDVRRRLDTNKGFVWLKRELTPQQQQIVHRLGVPGIGFLRENRRIYPNGRAAAHILGHVNVDNEGLAGIERYIDGAGLGDLHAFGFARDADQTPVDLALDLRVQHTMAEELATALTTFNAKAASGVVMDIHTGEIVAMASLPDYDPNNPVGALDPANLNRMTTGVFEMGSVFKTFTTAMALDAGLVTTQSLINARGNLRVGRHSIGDFHPENRVLTVEEVFTYSSNVGTGRLALLAGKDHHKAFLQKMGLLDRLRTEVPESGSPIVPARWGDINTVTISFGHGLSVTPLQTAAAAAALMNGGVYVTPTFLKRTREETTGTRVVSAETSADMVGLMKANAERGSGRKAAEIAKGYRLGGKTGTSEKAINGRYSKNRLFTSFLSAFPIDAPRYVVLVSLDEPQATKDTYGYATAGWNAAPTVGKIVARIGPMLGIAPSERLALKVVR